MPYGCYDPAMSDARMPILVDCDTGIDDSLALLYAVASPECELVAVTCTAGNVDARQVAENTRAVLELAGRGDIERIQFRGLGKRGQWIKSDNAAR